MTAIHEIHGDMRYNATGVHAAGTTTFTLGIEVAGLNRVVNISSGLDAAATRTGVKTYTCPGDLSGDCVLFASFDSYIEPSRFHPRLQEGNLVRLESDFLPQKFVAFVSADTYCSITGSKAKLSDGTEEAPYQSRDIHNVPSVLGKARSVPLPLAGEGRAMTIRINSSGHHHMTVHGWEVRGNLQENANP